MDHETRVHYIVYCPFCKNNSSTKFCIEGFEFTYGTVFFSHINFYHKGAVTGIEAKNAFNKLCDLTLKMKYGINKDTTPLPKPLPLDIWLNNQTTNKQTQTQTQSQQQQNNGLNITNLQFSSEPKRLIKYNDAYIEKCINNKSDLDILENFINNASIENLNDLKDIMRSLTNSMKVRHYQLNNNKTSDNDVHMVDLTSIKDLDDLFLNDPETLDIYLDGTNNLEDMLNGVKYMLKVTMERQKIIDMKGKNLSTQ